MMEKLLHFIWQFQYFNKNELLTEAGEPLQIIKQGFYNTNQGPDFSEATIKIDKLVLVGNIELHINASDWHKHHHGGDTNYSNIILHVVWNSDKPVLDRFGKQLPTLVLQNRIAKVMLLKYAELMNAGSVILCKKFLPALTDIGWLSWKERLVAERLEAKSKKVLQLYKESNHHWKETFWWMLSANFGIKVNTLVFETIAKIIPINILAKHKNQIHQLEALLLGQANLLNGFFVDDYPNMLKREYAFLQKKYALQQTLIAPAFLRMRPAAFPTIRLSQLAMLIHVIFQWYKIFIPVARQSNGLSKKNLCPCTPLQNPGDYENPRTYKTHGNVRRAVGSEKKICPCTPHKSSVITKTQGITKPMGMFVELSAQKKKICPCTPHKSSGITKTTGITKPMGMFVELSAQKKKFVRVHLTNPRGLRKPKGLQNPWECSSSCRLRKKNLSVYTSQILGDYENPRDYKTHGNVRRAVGSEKKNLSVYTSQILGDYENPRDYKTHGNVRQAVGSEKKNLSVYTSQILGDYENPRDYKTHGNVRRAVGSEKKICPCTPHKSSGITKTQGLQNPWECSSSCRLRKKNLSVYISQILGDYENPRDYKTHGNVRRDVGSEKKIVRVHLTNPRGLRKPQGLQNPWECSSSCRLRKKNLSVYTSQILGDYETPVITKTSGITKPIGMFAEL